MITVTELVEPSKLSNRQPAPIIENYQALAHRLLSSTTSAGAVLRSIGVTSSGTGEGVSTVAAQLASTVAAISSRPVLLLDLNPTDVRRAATLRVWGAMGLQDPSAPIAAPRSGVCESRFQNLSLLSCRDAEQLRAPLDRSKVSALLAELNDEFGLIIVDMPPATESSLTLAMAGLLSGVLLVIEAEGTHSEAARRAQQNLSQAQANVLGVIMNKRTQHIPGWLYSRL
jgi:Mrp family chromosome partitioning ATPase